MGPNGTNVNRFGAANCLRLATLSIAKLGRTPTLHLHSGRLRSAFATHAKSLGESAAGRECVHGRLRTILNEN
jgi:hypothetical protein